MLYDQRRKRGRLPLTAAPRAPPTVRRANAPAAIAPTLLLTPSSLYVPTGRSAQSRILAALPRFSDAQPPPHYPRQQQPLWTRRSAVAVATPASDAHADTSALLVSPGERVDVRKLIRHAHRAHKLLLDRLTVVNLRRSHRCELAEEITRLKRVLAELQSQIDTTTRNVAVMDRLVQHLQKITSIFDVGATTGQRVDNGAGGDGDGDDNAVVVSSTPQRSDEVSAAVAAAQLNMPAVAGATSAAEFTAEEVDRADVNEPQGEPRSESLVAATAGDESPRATAAATTAATSKDVGGAAGT